MNRLNKLKAAISPIIRVQGFSSRRPTKRSSPRPTASRPEKSSKELSVQEIADSWVAVDDKASGQMYYWNTQTNETTALGAPKPTGPTALGPAQPQYLQQQQPQTGGAMSGLGGMIAQGMAFGVGSSLGHAAIGSMFGGGSRHDDGGGSLGGGGDDTFDI